MADQKKGIQANLLFKTTGRKRERYEFDFVDGNCTFTYRENGQTADTGDQIPEKVVVCPGARDTITGAVITLELIQKIHRMDDVERAKNSDVAHTEDKKAWKKRLTAEKEHIREKLRESLQREPSEFEVENFAKETAGRQLMMSCDLLWADDPDEDPMLQIEAEETAEPQELIQDDDVDIMRECVKAMPEDLQQIYQCTIENIGGGAGRRTKVSLAAELGIPESTYRLKEMKMKALIREAVEEGRRRRAQEEG